MPVFIVTRCQNCGQRIEAKVSTRQMLPAEVLYGAPLSFVCPSPFCAAAVAASRRLIGLGWMLVHPMLRTEAVA